MEDTLVDEKNKLILEMQDILLKILMAGDMEILKCRGPVIYGILASEDPLQQFLIFLMGCY